MDDAADLGEEGVVLAAAHVGAGLQRCAALADDDGAAEDALPPNTLTPSRCAFESRPFLEEPKPFLCAIRLPLSRRLRTRA